MNPIILYEIAKATYEVNNSTKFFGKTYEDYDAWFRQIWDILGTSAKNYTVATSYALGTLYEIRLGFNQSLYSRNALYQ